MIYFTSDLHFSHNKEFIYGPRGFKSVDEMNKTILNNWNNLVNIEDDVYVLGDLMLSDTEAGLRLLKQLKGKIHIILGNHDSAERQEAYKECHNVVEVCWAKQIKIKGQPLFLSHYPTMTCNYEVERGKPMPRCLINLYGHTHQKTNFFDEKNPYIYHVGLDSHNCTPITFESIIEEIKAQKLKLNM